MGNAGRKSKYSTHVEPRLAEITEMAKSLTERQIAENLGVGYRNFCDYKSKYPQLEQAIKSGRQKLVIDLKNTLITKAKGYMYEETKTVTENNGKKKTEIYTKYAHPDVAAINLLLKNYDKENWSNDPQMMDIKKKELELKEKAAELNNW